MTVEKLIARVGADITPFQAGMKKVTSIAKKTAAAIVGIGTAAAAVGAKFEFELTKTATVAQAFGKDLEALEKTARRLGAVTEFGSTKAAAGMYDLASAGFDTKEIIESTEHAMKLAGATGAELGQATHLLAASIKQFGFEAKDSKRIVDTYAQAITSSQLTMERLSQAMKFAGTAGAALGWDIEETTAAVAQFANLGLEGSMAGTNLRMAMIQLSKQSNIVVKTLSELGLTFQEVNPETHTFGEILTAVGKRAITGSQAVDLFGSRAGLNMKRLAEAAAAGTLQFDEFVKKLREAQEGAGRADVMYQRLMETFRNQWKVVMSAASGVFKAIFVTMKEDSVEAFKKLTGGLRSISGWIREHKEDIRIFWSNLYSWIEAAAHMASLLVGILGKLVEVIAAANRETISGLSAMHGELTREEAGVEEAMQKRLTFTETWGIKLNAYVDEIAKKLGKRPQDVGLLDIILKLTPETIEAGLGAANRALEELIEKEALLGQAARRRAFAEEARRKGIAPPEPAPSFLPTGAAPGEQEVALGMKGFRLAQQTREASKERVEIIKNLMKKLEDLNAKHVMSEYQARKVANARAVEEIRDHYDHLISQLKNYTNTETQIAQATANKAAAIAKKRAELEQKYMSAAGAEEWAAHERAIASTDALVKAMSAEEEALEYIETLEIQFADSSVERLRLEHERKMEVIKKFLQERIALLRAANQKEAAQELENALKRVTASAGAQTEKAITDQRVAAERAAQEQILQARVTTADNIFSKMRSQHELELALNAQKEADLIQQIEESGMAKAEKLRLIDEVITANSMATAKKESDFYRATQEQKLQIANTIAGQMSATADALYQSGIIKGKKAFAALKAIKIVEAVIHTATAIIKTLGEPTLPFPSNVIMAAMIGAMGAAQVYAISQQQPPAYAEGGIVRGRQDGRGRMIRAGEYGDELVVPLRGGKVPVAMVGGGGVGSPQVVEQHEHYHFDNATFMDQATLAASMETIAVAGVRKDYRNDGPTRSMIRSRR